MSRYEVSTHTPPPQHSLALFASNRQRRNDNSFLARAASTEGTWYIAITNVQLLHDECPVGLSVQTGKQKNDILFLAMSAFTEGYVVQSPMYNSSVTNSRYRLDTALRSQLDVKQ